MNKIKDYLKNKTIGYYIVAALALVALIFGIFFFISYNNTTLFPGVENTPTMGNKAAGLAVETIGIFVFAGAAVEIAVLVVPQYRFLQIIAVLMFGLAFMKDVNVIADFFAGIANNVMYNGGNVGLNFFYFIVLFLILVFSIVAAFFGFFKKEEEGTQEMKNVKGTANVIKLGSSAVLVLAAVLVSSIVSSSLTKTTGSNSNTGSSSSQKKEEDKINPITPEIEQIAADYDYSFDPLSVVFEQQEEWNYSDSTLSSVPYNGTRAGSNLVYYFEGAYSEGYQGDYSPTYCYLYLWDDGFFGGTSGKDNVRGYWYNSSLDAPEDDPSTPENEAIDCLCMVSNIAHFESISGVAKQGFYNYQAYMYLDMGKVWNQGTNARSIIMNGYAYYPEVALYVDSHTKQQLTCKVNEDVDISAWTPSRILKNLTYSSVFIQSDVNWSAEDGTVTVSYVDGSKNKGISSIIAKFTSAGEKDITISWNGLTASITVNVEE